MFWLLAGRNLSSAVNVFRTGVTALSLVLAAVMTVYATGAAQRRGKNSFAFGLWVAASVVLTPIVWLHHLTLLLIPLAQVAGAARSDVTAFRLGVFCYCTLELALLSYWVGWLLWPAYLFPIQVVTAGAAFTALLLAFGAAYTLAVSGSARSPSKLAVLRP
jgi:hypothetical protein